ncbi:LexA family transcriptional regulator [Candidatus Woesebacteria bacterium]|nr:LexA family transcriptional regulator [Candidatus Woesebacteria bacterium]
MRTPSDTQTNRLHALKKFFHRFRRFPTYDEMLSLFHVSSKNSIFKIVQKWIDAGILVKDSNQLVPTDAFFSLPLLGTIRAGSPTVEDNALTESISLDSYVVGNSENTYLLKVSGDSMIDEGIHPGDMVLIDRKREPHSGDIVAAYVDAEWTLKYYHKEKGRIVLTAANRAYSPIIPQASLEIGGVVVSVVRKYY